MSDETVRSVGEDQPEPRPSRSEAIRRLLSNALGGDEWNKTEPPKDRPFLAFARPGGIPEIIEAKMIVAEWNFSQDSFRPSGDKETGTELIILYWTELPEKPTARGRA